LTGRTADVVVIGAGVQGASLAYHLAARGARVVVVERSMIAAGATGRSSGVVRMHYDLAAEARLAWVSYPWFHDWSERIGGDCGFTETGFLWLEPAAREHLVRANVEMQRAIGIATQVIEADEIRRVFPALHVDEGDVAAWEPGSGYADPVSAANGLIGAARERGATLLQGAEVTSIAVTGGRVSGVSTSRGDVAAPVVVDVAGAWAARVASLVGLDIPVSVWRHDIAYISRPGPMADPFPVVADMSNRMYFRPEGSDLVLVGLEDHNPLGDDPDRDTSSAAHGFADRVVDRVLGRLPGLVDGSYHSDHSGQDGLTPDQRPILGAAGPDGFYLDCGHSGTGFKTSPAVGLGMAELILDGAATTVDISPFTLERFDRGALLEGEHGYGPTWR
jgi:glycine/D-amino acid oxidase-like deaminating enzyme